MELPQPAHSFLLDRIERMNLDVHVVDLRLDTAIPVVMAFLLRRDGELGGAFPGRGRESGSGSSDQLGTR